LNAFTTIAVANNAPLLTDMHKDEPLLRLNGYDPDTELPLLIRYRGQDAPEKAAAIDPPALVLIIGEVLRSTKRIGRKRPALVIEAQELDVIPLAVADTLSMSLAWEVQAHSFAVPGLPFLDADDEGNERRRF
jgi:hypothetical protein